MSHHTPSSGDSVQTPRSALDALAAVLADNAAEADTNDVGLTDLTWGVLRRVVAEAKREALTEAATEMRGRDLRDDDPWDKGYLTALLHLHMRAVGELR